MKWSEEQTCQFVKIYMEHEHLWNSKHDNYKVMSFRMKAYREIISEFRDLTGIELNVVDLKIKIKNLRSTYTQELAKIKRRSGPDSTYRSSLKWFALWHRNFVNIKKEEISTTYDNQQEPIEDSSEVWVAQTNNSDTNIDPFQDNEDYNNLVLKVEDNDSFRHENSQCKVKKKKNKQRSPSVEFSDRTFRGSMDSSDSTKEDEFDIYGKYIASQLRKMDLQKALRVQLEIQSLVSEARISDLVDKH